MSIGKLLLYGLGLLLAFVILSALVSLVLTIIGITLAVLQLLATLLVLGAVAYGVYKLYTLLSGSSGRTPEPAHTGTRTTTNDARSGGASNVDRLQRRYLNGELSEREFERQLERELDGGEFDSIDRELQRERI